jgi:hypothetical protein
MRPLKSITRSHGGNRKATDSRSFFLTVALREPYPPKFLPAPPAGTILFLAAFHGL